MVKRFCLGIISPYFVNLSKVSERPGHAGIIRPQRVLPNTQYPLVDQYRLVVISFFEIEQGEIVERGCDLRMIRTKEFS
jgi:hypothetical protein